MQDSKRLLLFIEMITAVHFKSSSIIDNGDDERSTILGG